MIRKEILGCIFCCLLLTWGCASSRITSSIKKSAVFSHHFTGFALYDPINKKYLSQSNADKYFTPASNTKILTLYTALLHLKDTAPILQYRSLNDTTFIRGVGHPGLLHPYLPEASSTWRWLKSVPGTLILEDRPSDQIFGPGWVWNDFADYYQPERSALPLYGNVMILRAAPHDSTLVVSPLAFEAYERRLNDQDTLPNITRRDYMDNRWYYNGAPAGKSGLYRELPFHTSPALSSVLLQDTLSRTVNWSGSTAAKNWQNLPGDIPLDSLYKLMMHVSDNFIAEQLLWLSAHQTSGTLITDSIIHLMQKNYLTSLSDSLQWVDGSGLSRYNLFTPRSMVEILEHIYHQKPMAWIKDIFPTGGVNGTLTNWYKGPEGHPYVWAKTGSLWNMNTLSGYVVTRRGRVLIFSFMHNNFTYPTVQLRREMKYILEKIYTSL